MAAEEKDPDAQHLDRRTPANRPFQPGLHAGPDKKGTGSIYAGRINLPAGVPVAVILQGGSLTIPQKRDTQKRDRFY
jgi:hypothetical protein